MDSATLDQVCDAPKSEFEFAGPSEAGRKKKRRASRAADPDDETDWFDTEL